MVQESGQAHRWDGNWKPSNSECNIIPQCEGTLCGKKLQLTAVNFSYKEICRQCSGTSFYICFCSLPFLLNFLPLLCIPKELIQVILVACFGCIWVRQSYLKILNFLSYSISELSIYF